MTKMMPPQADMSRGLFWVKGELSQCLQRVRGQIEGYLEDGPDHQHMLAEALTDIEQIASIASVIQCYSVHLLASEMAVTLQQALDVPPEDGEACLSALVGATLQLFDYIELLAHGESDHPLVFSPSINELRVARGDTIASRVQLFCRYLDARGLDVRPPKGAHRRPGVSQALAQKHSQVVQKAVLGAIRDEKRPRALQVLAQAAGQMASTVVDPRLYQCWRGVELMSLVLIAEPERATPDVQKLLAKTGQCIRALATNGEAPMARAAGTLGAQCLHLGVFSAADGAELASIRAEFGLGSAHLTEDHLQALRSRLAQPNIESLQTVTREIRNNLHDIKDTIDLALRSGGQAAAVGGLVDGLKTVGSTLSMLGLDALGQLAQTQAENIGMLEDGGDDEQWMQVAESMLRIEQGLEAELMPTRSLLVDRTAHQDLKEGVGAVLRESLINLARIKTELDQYIARGQTASLDTVIQLLGEIVSAFDLLGISQAVDTVTRVQACMVPARIAAARTRAAVADRLADVVAGVEYYVEAVQEQQPNTDRLLLDVDHYIELLDEAVLAGEHTDEEAVAPVVTPAAEVDPEFREIFIEESREVLAEMEAALPRWTQNPSDAGLLDTMRRGFHTLKGSGRMVGALEIGDFAWGIEDMLNRCREGALALGGEVTDLVVAAVQMLPEVVRCFAEGDSAQATIAPLQDKIARLLGRAQENDQLQEEVVRIFLEDADAYLQDLATTQQSGHRVAVGEPLVRLMHSMRGGAAAAGLGAVSQLAAIAERLTQGLRTCNQPISSDVLQQLHTAFSEQIELARVGQEPQIATELEAELKDQLHHLQSASDGIDLELAAVFSEEALGLLEDAESELQNWSAQPDSQVAQKNLQRIFHTVKGSAKTAGALGLGQVGEVLDELMKAVLVGQVGRPDQSMFARIGQAVMASYNLLDEFREGRDADPSAVLALLRGESAEIGFEPAVASDDTAATVAMDETQLVSFDEPLPELEQADSVAWEDVAEVVEVAEEVVAADLTVEMSAEPEAVISPVAEVSIAEDVWPGDEEILSLFEAEAQELLESIDQHFASWEDDQSSVEHLRALQRDLHTFKGGARMSGLHSLGQIAHAMESIFSTLEQGEGADAGVFGRLHHAIDGLHHQLDGLRAGHAPQGTQELLDDLRGGASGEIALTPLDLLAAQAVDAEPDLVSEEPQILADVTEDYSSELDIQEPAYSVPRAADVVSVAPNDDARELMEIFLPEGAELLEGFDGLRSDLRSADQPAAALGEILRILHTLKGGARMASLDGLGDAVHELESGLEAISRGHGSVDEGVHQQLQGASDAFHEHLAVAKQMLTGGAVPLEAPVAVEPTLAADLRDIPNIADIAEPLAPVSAAPKARAWAEALQWEAPQDERLAAIRKETARVSVEQLDTMLNEAGEISIYRSRLERQVSSFSTQLREVEQTISRIRDQLRMLESETDAQIQARTQGSQTGETESDRYGEEFDPLEMDRYSRMQELTRALSESVTDLSSLHGSMTNVVSETDTLLLQQGRVNTSVQQGLMGTLMVPFSRQVQRLQRVARQTAGDNHKQVELVLDGIDAEMDRNVLERMTPVIEHVLRNCVVHGIEVPADRTAAGKAPVGQVHINLNRDGSKLAIEIRDDGRGLDFDRIRQKAVERGIMKADAQLDESELAQFIFLPGFSTAETLTQDAGRGVGMDVVAAEVKQLGGTLELDSKTGQGARFVIRLPLSLAISQALLVQVGEDVYATPLATIEGIARVPVDDLAQYMDDQQTFSYGNQQYRVRYLGQLLGGESSSASTDRGFVPVILVHTGEGMGISDRRVAVVVDQLLGSRELVTKTAGPQVSTVAGVTGATIQADGRVVLILDVVALVQDRLRKTLRSTDAAPVEARSEGHQPTVMVIDDSITMRRVAERVLTRNGYRVTTAKDGMDGIAQLQSDTPDAVLLDIEMPKVDGFEVASFIRNNERLAKVPIIMITSRSGDKHRERAAAIGVNRYLIKPYQEQQLITELHELMVVPA